MGSSSKFAHITAARAPLRGTLRLSGDKSVSIRRALFSLFTNESVELTNYGTGEDCQTALLCLETLGKKVERMNGRVIIRGTRIASNVTLDCRNSGTTARLLMGILAGREGEWTLVGDESLSKRPMERVARPLRSMGARIDVQSNGCLPARIVGKRLAGVDHDLHVASAQVKSALLLAGLSATGTTRVREPQASRDHTERLLRIRQGDDLYWAVDESTLTRERMTLSGEIPGDISSAAFWAIAAMLVMGSSLRIETVLLNPLRAGWFECLRRAGANVRATVTGEVCGEPVGTMEFEHVKLAPLHVSASEVPGLIDEIPALAVLAATIEGASRFEEVGELRVKESDRLQAIADGLRAIGAETVVVGNDLIVKGGMKLSGAEINPREDHRIAMAFALCGLTASGETVIQDADCAAVSYPEFFVELERLGVNTVRYSN